MATATCVEKTVVVATLRSRDQHGRADWVDKEFPAVIDTARNMSLLQTLGIDVKTLTLDTAPATSGRQAQPETRGETRGEQVGA
jgi:hypothetical protein